jgi:hypothetical protein
MGHSRFRRSAMAALATNSARCWCRSEIDMNKGYRAVAA